MYQAASQPAAPAASCVRVVLTFDVPAGLIELPRRTAQLADEYGRIIARSVPGVQVRPAEVMPATEPPAATSPVSGAGVRIGRNGLWIDGAPIRLTQREFELLRYLADRQERSVARAELILRVWPDPQVSARTVDTYVRRLRAKLGDHADSVRTVRGYGYRWDPADAGPHTATSLTG